MKIKKPEQSMKDFRSICYLLGCKAAKKGTALLVALVFLLLSGFATLGKSQHAMSHGGTDHHGDQHSSFFCAWKCTAANFVESSPKGPHILFGPPQRYFQFFSDLFIPGDSLTFINPRAPPF